MITGSDGEPVGGVRDPATGALVPVVPAPEEGVAVPVVQPVAEGVQEGPTTE
jgi:hypothetical protein